MNANAETGSVTVSNETHANWTRPEAYVSSVKIPLDKMENFSFDTGNFTSFVNYTIFDPAGEITYAFPNEVTSFQITENGSGHGVASYSQFLHNMNWVCGGDCVISGQFFKVTYDENIFNNLSISGGGANGWQFVSALTGAPPPANNTNNSMPMYVYNGSVQGASFANRSLLGYDKAPNTRRFIFSGTFTSGTVTNFYNITYPAQGFYLANISKSGQTIKTKDFLHTQTNNSQGYYAEAALNNNSFQVLMPQLDGIYLNVTMGTGDFNDVLINASGSTVVTPTPAPTIPPIPAGSDASISFDKTNYTVGDTGFILVNSSQLSTFFGLYTYRVDFYSATNPLINKFDINMGQASNTFTVSFSKEDTYTANLVKHNILLGTDNVIGTDSAQALISLGFLDAPNLVQVGKLFNTTYMFGAQPTLSHINGIKTFFIDAGIPVQENFFTVGNTTPGILLYTNISVNRKGAYVLYLVDAGRGNVASKSIQSDYFENGNTSLNITASNISILNPQPSNAYGYNDLMQVTFQADNTNWTNGSQQILIDVYNVDTNTETIEFPVTDQVGSFSFFLQNGYYPNGFFAPGSNNVRLVGKDSDGNTIVLDYKNFSISNVNDAGYGLSLDKFSACTNENIRITYITLVPANFSIKQIKSNGNSQLELGVVNGTRTLVRSFSVPGSFLIQLIRQSDNTIQQEAKVDIRACAVITPTVPPTGTQQASSLITLITSNIFWALIITVGLMIFVAWRTKDGFPTAVTGFLVGGIFTFLGWIPAWIFFSLFVIAALLVASSIVEKQIRNVTGK